MASILDLRRRIRSVKNTRQITKAMKMVAAAKLRRAQERAISTRPYARMLVSVLESLKRRIEIYDPITGEVQHPLLLAREEKNVLLLVISGDKGFAGAFNANITKAAFNFLDEKAGQQIDIQAIGRKGYELFRRRYPKAALPERGEAAEDHSPDGDEPRERSRAGRIELLPDHPGILDKIDINAVREISDEICERYIHEEIDAVYLVYNEFKSVIAQRVVIERLLPIIEIGKQDVRAAQEMTQEERARAVEAARTAGVSAYGAEISADQAEAEEEAKRFGTAEVDYIYDQPPAQLFATLLPRYVLALIFRAMLESAAAEQAARMTAMDSATNNASEMIDTYTLQMNRARQAAITKEIIEIVSGAAAL